VSKGSEYKVSAFHCKILLLAPHVLIFFFFKIKIKK